MIETTEVALPHLEGLLKDLASALMFVLYVLGLFNSSNFSIRDIDPMEIIFVLVFYSRLDIPCTSGL